MTRTRHITDWFNSMRILGVVILAAAAVSLSAQEAEPDAQATALSSELLERLGSPDYTERERATDELLTQEDLPLQTIADWVEEHRNNPEVRYRLMDVLRHHVLQEMQEQISNDGGPGSMGIQHQFQAPGTLPGEDGVTILVINTLPGFPAYGRLHPGDVIFRFADQPIPPAVGNNPGEHFKAMIRAHTAGDMVQLAVRRDGEELAVDLRLAGGNALQKMYPGQRSAITLQHEYAERWRQTQDRLLQVNPEPAGEADTPPDL